MLNRIKSFLAYRHPKLSTGWKVFAAILFIINSVLIPTFIGLSWEATQTLDSVRVDCTPYYFSSPAKEASQILQLNRFNASILFDNPTFLVLHLTWSVSMIFNVSATLDTFWLSTDVGPGTHWATIQVLYQEPYARNLNMSLVSVSYLEIESVSSFLTQDRYTLTALPYVETVPHGMSLGNYTANRLNSIIRYVFIQHHNVDNWKAIQPCSSLAGGF
jgi:hypothetical protein